LEYDDPVRHLVQGRGQVTVLGPVQMAVLIRRLVVVRTQEMVSGMALHLVMGARLPDVVQVHRLVLVQVLDQDL
jgi:hypothetical protein